MADTRAVRRIAQTLTAVGALLLAMTAVALAQDPTPTPTPTPSPTPTAAPVVETITPTPTPSPTVTVTPTPTATPSPSPTPVVTDAVRQSPTPPPEPTPTPPEQFTGASLTICHWTGTEYVAVTITADQYSGYFDQPLDIIPAPAAGCAGLDPAQAGGEPVTVCHRNPDGTYTLLRYPGGDLGGHEGDVGDLIPAPSGTCPGLAPATAAATPTPTPEATPDPPASATDGDVVAQATPRPHRTATPAPATTAATAAPVATTAQSGTTMAVAATTEQLPFTGFDLGLIAALGLAFVMMGAGLRLIAQPAVGVTR